MFVILDAAAGGEMVRTDNAVVGEYNTARCHTKICSVIGNRAAHATYQPTCRRKEESKCHGARRVITAQVRSERPLITFRDVGAVGISDEAGEANVDGAAETSVHGYGRGVVGDALAMIKLPAHRDHAAPHILTALFTHKTGVESWTQEKSQV